MHFYALPNYLVPAAIRLASRPMQPLGLALMLAEEEEGRSKKNNKKTKKKTKKKKTKKKTKKKKKKPSFPQIYVSIKKQWNLKHNGTMDLPAKVTNT